MITAAQIKRGNSYILDSLQEIILQLVQLPPTKHIKPVKFTLYQCITTLVEILSEYVRSPYQVSFNIFLVDWHVRKYQRDQEIYRHFMGLTYSLKKYLDSHEDAKLFLTLFDHDRNSKENIKWFLKLRKTILKTINSKILAQISISHSDAITIAHMIYEDPLKSQIIKKINELFISLKRKLINTAKIDGAVACQFFLKAEQDINKQQIGTYKKGSPEKPPRNNRQLQGSLGSHNNVSFNLEYGNFMSNDNNSYEDDSIADEGELSKKEFDYAEIEKQWEEREDLFALQDSKYSTSLKKLSELDKNIDKRLENSGLLKRQKYPDGWEEFILTNSLMKEKLLKRSNY